ncbi:MAG: DUF3137 domain-containing protein [Lachnospiraceae bacterium]|nr:DUF3137 domain-containing protein [Lachnospiraceae bacterium]
MADNEFLLKQKAKYEKISTMIVALGGIIIGFCVLSSVFLIVGEENEEMGFHLLKLTPIGLFIIIVGMVVYNKVEKSKNIYKKNFFKDLVPKTLEDIFDSVIYNYETGFTRESIIHLDLFGLPTILPLQDVSSWNYLSANYKGVFFKCGDVKLYSGKRYLFYGRLLEIDYPLSGSMRLKLYSRNFTDVNQDLFSLGKLEKIQTTGNEFFDNEFQVWSDNEQYFEKIITPQMIEKLQLFHHMYDEIAIAFYNDKLYIALDKKSLYFTATMMHVTDLVYESYEPDYSRTTDYQYQINKIKKDARFITDAIDIFCQD